jgi:hypothetical protein
MPFHILPNEVVSEIFFQIEDRSTLYSLSLCSHRIHEIVEPVLYNVFEDTRPLDLVLFLRTILQNPRLGFHVRKFDARDRRFAILPAGRGRGALRTALPPVPQEPAFYLGCFEQDDWSRLCMIFFSILLSPMRGIFIVISIELCEHAFDSNALCLEQQFKYEPDLVIYQVRQFVQ